MIVAKAPWRQHPLDKWKIDEMKHLDDDEKRLWIKMSCGNNTIVEFGPDDNDIWMRLHEIAMGFE